MRIKKYLFPGIGAVSLSLAAGAGISSYKKGLSLENRVLLKSSELSKISSEDIKKWEEIKNKVKEKKDKRLDYSNKSNEANKKLITARNKKYDECATNSEKEECKSAITAFDKANKEHKRAIEISVSNNKEFLNYEKDLENWACFLSGKNYLEKLLKNKYKDKRKAFILIQQISNLLESKDFQNLWKKNKEIKKFLD